MLKMNEIYINFKQYLKSYASLMILSKNTFLSNDMVHIFSMKLFDLLA